MPDPPPGAFIVRVLGPAGHPVGVGALVTERHVVTCAHVVNAALGLDARAQHQPTDAVTLDFPLARPAGPGHAPTLSATVERWLPPPREGAAGDDIAGLVLVDAHAPEGATAGRLAVDTPRPGRTVHVFGYPAGRPDGSWVEAAVRGPVGGGRLQLDSDSALRVQRGFSGSPVFDHGIGRIVGLVASAPPGAADRDSYAISTDRLRLAWPEVLSGRWQPGGGTPRGRDRTELTILHVSDTQFGAHHLFGGNGLTPSDRTADTLFSRLHRDLADLASEQGLRPDLLMVTGDLAELGLRSEFRQVSEFLAELSEAAEIPRRHIAIVPGNHDINRKACEAYFAEQESDEGTPVAPYWPKWRQFVSAFEDFYAGIDTVTFTPDEPWTLFEMPELAVVVAGLNSTMAESHREADHYGWIGEHQLRWFADRLAGYRARGWLRLAAVHHNVVRGAVIDDENLRDADVLDRIIGDTGLANLLLHGHTHDAKLHWLPSGLPVLSTGSAAVDTAARPAEVPNQYQLITVRRDGFTRYARQYALGQRRWIGDTRISRTGSDWRDSRPRELTDVDTAFPPQAAADEPATAETEARGRIASPRTRARPADRRGSDPMTGEDGGISEPGDSWLADGSPEEFLERIAEATRVRFPEAKVTKRPEGGYLRVSHPLPGGGAEQQPIGVIAGHATEAALDAFIDNVHARFAAADPSVRSELVYGGSPAPGQLVAQARRRGVRLRSLIEYQGLLDLRPLAEAQRERLAADLIYPARMYVPQRYRMVSGGADDVASGLIEQTVGWLGADDARLVIVLGDFGRGKTSFLRQLTRTLPAELPGLLPILVELRNLEKAPTLDELLSQYLVRQGVQDINPAKLRYMIHSGRVGLLFDGFDELELRVGYDNAADYLQTLLASVTGRAKVVLTSRTQHFRSTEQVKTALGERVTTLSASRMVVLEDFSEAQIIQFLTNLFGDAARARARFDLLGDIGNLLDLAHNPRMLAFIAELDEDRLRAARDKEGRISAAGLYREIIDFWLTAEAERQRHRRGLPSLDKDERLSACTALALRLWASNDYTIALNDLSAEVSATLTGLAERGYSDEQASHSIGSGSLLIRTDDGAFAFVHQSIMEWLVAAAAAGNLDHPRAAQILTTRRISRLMAEFFTDLAGYPAARGWVGRVLTDSHAPNAAKQNALVISDLAGKTGPNDPAGGQQERPNLAGVDLRAQDLTNRDLRLANLRGASLRGMRLRGTNLAGADLTDADLTGARLVGCSLHGAVLTGSRWARAALLGTAVPDELAVSPELAAAAIVGRDPAAAMIQPAGLPTSVAFSPDGTLLAVGARSGVQLIDPADATVLRVLPGVTGTVLGVAFSPNGALLATASEDAAARIWDLTTGTVRSTLPGHSGAVRSVAFSPDGTMLATGDDGGTGRIWNIATSTVPTIRSTLKGHEGAVMSVAFSPDGTQLATADDYGPARIWDLTTETGRKTSITLKGHEGAVLSVAFSPDGTLLATASADRTARIWDLATGITRTTLEGHNGAVLSVAFSPDGTLLATAADVTAHIWDLATGTNRNTLAGHTSAVLSVAFSPDGTLLATASAGGTARIWDLATSTSPTTRSTLQGHTRAVRSAAFSPDGALLATGATDRTARIWDLATSTSPTTRSTLQGHIDWVSCVTFSPDGALLATASYDGTVRIWPLATGTGRPTSTTLHEHSSGVLGVAFSPDGTALASASNDGTARIWDLATSTGAKTRSTLHGRAGAVRGVAFSPDGTLLATASANSTAQIWDLTERRATRLIRRREQPVVILEGHIGSVNGVAFSPDGTQVVTVSDDSTARIWDLATGTNFTTLRGHTGYVLGVAFSPDGTQVVTVSADRTARIWDLTAETATCRTLRGHTGSVLGVAFSSDGTLLVTASDDGTVRIWEVDTGTVRVTLAEFSKGGYASLSLDGYRVEGDLDNRLWWAIKLCRFAPGELDPYVPGLRRLAADAPLP